MNENLILSIFIVIPLVSVFAIMRFAELIRFIKPRSMKKVSELAVDNYNQKPLERCKLTENEMEILNTRLSNDGGIYGIFAVAMLFALVVLYSGIDLIWLRVIGSFLLIGYAALYISTYQKRIQKDFFQKKDDFYKMSAFVVDVKKNWLPSRYGNRSAIYFAFVLCKNQDQSLAYYKIQITPQMFGALKKNDICWGVFYKDRFVNIIL